MTQVTVYLDEYAADHQHPVNKWLHTLCVPIIVISLLGLLWCIPVPGFGGNRPVFVNWATVTALVILAWYLRLSPRLALGMCVAFVSTAFIILMLEQLPVPLWRTSIALFAVGWVGQFIGHGFEGKRPSFFRDLRFLLIGPLWVLSGLFQRLGIAVVPEGSGRSLAG